MIGYLRGKIIFSEKGYVILDVSGVGYRVFVPENIEITDEETELYITTSVTENAITLYGFSRAEDKKVFDILCEAHGIGPKTAIGFLGTMSGSDIANAVVNEDENMLSRVPGVSAKKAQKLILELKDKFSGMPLSISQDKNITYKIEATDALVALGYNRGLAQKTVDNVCSSYDLKDVSRIITKALALLSKKV